MARFECSRCGRCCMNFGHYIIIEGQLEGGRFSCYSRLSGEHFVAQLMESRRNGTSGRGRTYPCPFLKNEPRSERYLCAIYPTRPNFCREFRCSHMDIFNSAGERVGRVGGKKSLLSKDRPLLTFWDREISPLATDDDQTWLPRAQSMLENAGYRVVRYE
ncbi:MAG: YkgJ family cysteine cluster protein [Methanomicrobiales archaeon]|nr:YkgJ family cysteine cluster protein [Methanomicrobiales archaeon]